MTDFQSIVYTWGGDCIRALAMVLCVLQLRMAIVAIQQKRKAAYAALTAVHFLVGLALLYILLDGTYAANRLGYQTPLEAPHPAFVWAAYGLPWMVYAALEALSIILLILCRRSNIRYGRTHVSPDAVKETVDLLPVGVCFGTKDGLALLSNVQMERLSRLITGRHLTDVNRFWEEICRRGESHDGQRLCFCPDGRTMLFAQCPVEVQGETYRQITATDVTAAYRITEELRQKNDRLRDIQLRMKAYQAQASDVVILQETINARIAVHDELGTVLLTSRYFFDHPEAGDPEALYRMMQQANTYFLREAEEEATVQDALSEALKMARAIGVTVEMEGIVPGDVDARAILGQAIRECAANAVKHAEGDTLTLSITEAGQEMRCCFSNNGLPPKGPIQETGGLKSLRRMAEDAGGRMTVESDPAFRIMLILPRMEA